MIALGEYMFESFLEYMQEGYSKFGSEKYYKMFIEHITRENF